MAMSRTFLLAALAETLWWCGGAADASGRAQRLRGGVSGNATGPVTAQTLGRRLWEDPIYDEIDSGAGVLVHNMHSYDVSALMDVFDDNGDFQDWKTYADVDLVNDCHSDTNQDTS